VAAQPFKITQSARPARTLMLLLPQSRLRRFRPEADIHVVQMAWPSQQPVLYFLFLSPP